jgi:hypothetical protein
VLILSQSGIYDFGKIVLDMVSEIIHISLDEFQAVLQGNFSSDSCSNQSNLAISILLPKRNNVADKDPENPEEVLAVSNRVELWLFFHAKIKLFNAESRFRVFGGRLDVDRKLSSFFICFLLYSNGFEHVLESNARGNS